MTNVVLGMTSSRSKRHRWFLSGPKEVSTKREGLGAKTTTMVLMRSEIERSPVDVDWEEVATLEEEDEDDDDEGKLYPRLPRLTGLVGEFLVGVVVVVVEGG
ncbi:uncharacterized protein DS421_5g166720 [Arachis hypogaea]|nr:uncharacterized protein DS421_5g166720 [Arachis hypogaea]